MTIRVAFTDGYILYDVFAALTSPRYKVAAAILINSWLVLDTDVY